VLTQVIRTADPHGGVSLRCETPPSWLTPDGAWLKAASPGHG